MRALRAKARDMDEYKRAKYLTFFRVAYFFAATSLCITYFHIRGKYDKLEQEKKNQLLREAGRPIIRDDSEVHAALRKRGDEIGEIYRYSPEKGWHLEEFHREEYLSKLQKQALEDAREAQRKALAEGRELPNDAIVLIDEVGSR